MKHELTPREREVLALMAEGLTNKAIGERLNIKSSTVKNHIYAIYVTLRVDDDPEQVSRVSAVLAWQRQEGL